jgi:shikimate dehydrogenase
MGVANLDGLLVTVPFKSRMLPFAGNLGASARAVGAVNALRREANGSWSADIFDGIGFVRGVEKKGGEVRGRRVVLFGAGGAGSAIACALAEAGAASIDVIDEVPGKAQVLVERLGAHFPNCTAAVATGIGSAPDMLVNASPVGMRAGDGLPGRIDDLRDSMFVGDVIIRETPTPLIQLAMAKGCQWTQGQDMLAGQAESLLNFFGVPMRPIADT